MFGEKKTEKYKDRFIDVWQMDKYKESKKVAQQIIKDYDSITEGDFWILKNYVKSADKMGYSGLIISHNGCLKLNDTLPEERRFKPSCVTVDKEGYNKSLVFIYCCDEQGIYEVGEFSPTNSSQAYPYAMAFKRMFDRVVLKLTKLAYGGIYSEVEADEFRAPEDDAPDAPDNGAPKSNQRAPAVEAVVESASNALKKYYATLHEKGWVKAKLSDILKQAGWDGKSKIDDDLISKATIILMEAENEHR